MSAFVIDDKPTAAKEAKKPERGDYKVFSPSAVGNQITAFRLDETGASPELLAQYKTLVHQWNDHVVPVIDKFLASNDQTAQKFGKIIRRIGTNLNHALTTQRPANDLISYFLNDNQFIKQVALASSVSDSELKGLRQVLNEVSAIKLLDPQGNKIISIATNGVIMRMGIIILRAHSIGLEDRKDIAALEGIFVNLKDRLDQVVRLKVRINPKEIDASEYMGIQTELALSEFRQKPPVRARFKYDVYDSKNRFAVIEKLAQATIALRDYYSKPSMETKDVCREALTKVLAVSREVFNSMTTEGEMGNRVDCNIGGRLIAESEKDHLALTRFFECKEPNPATDKFDILLKDFADHLERIVESTERRIHSAAN